MNSPLRNLPRLEAEAYRGSTAVHWTFNMEGRATGWLSSPFHAHFREVLTHMGARYKCITPIYCLMPDHLHVMLKGIHKEADLYLASTFLRKYTAQNLLPVHYQKQAYDHVLNEKEYERGAFEKICFYIAANPVRAGLCMNARDHAFSGCVIPGYPHLQVHTEVYWDLFWKTHHRLTAAATQQCDRRA